MDTAAPQWPVQGIGVVNKSSVEKKARPGKEQAALNCPRCASANTKFCYYNNYSLSQPRYFCKACRRYWTEGGCLRNVPVGGGSRKNRRPSSASAAAAAAPSPIPSPNYKSSGGQDLNLAYNIGMSEYIALPFDSQNPNFQNHPPPPPLPVMEFFKPASVYGGGFSGEGYYGNLQGANDGGGNNNSSSRNVCVFPFGEMKQADQQNEQASHGFWNGMLAGGSTW